MTTINIGDIVEAHYNSGVYLGKVMEDRRNVYLVKVLAVQTHPTQGDLHNPGQVEGVAFFERKALAYREQMNAPKRKVYSHEGDLPDYGISLKKAVRTLKKQLESEDTLYNQAAMQKLLDLEKHYYIKSGY